MLPCLQNRTGLAAATRRSVRVRLVALTALAGTFGMSGCSMSEGGGLSTDWSVHGGDASETRSSALADISAQSVSRLGVAWSADLSDISQRAFEATPLVVDGKLYVSTGWSNVVAFDAATGRKLWQYDPQVRKDYAGKGCCGPVSRGVAYAAGKVFLAAFDGRLIALDAASGKPLWTTLTVDQSQDYTVTGAPRIVGDKVLIGNGGAELGVRGYLSAYDIATGKLAWRFYTTPPRPGTTDHAASDAVWTRFGDTWAGEWWKLGGGGTVWDSMTYDPELDLLYVGVGNGGPWNRQLRSAGKGDNLFVSSIVALRPSTGEYVWHFQTTPGDEWDFTATQSIILADLMIDGKPRKVLMQAPKNGFFYVIDRTNGAFISGTPYVTVTWAKGLDPVTGRPIENPSIRYSENNATSVQQPGPLGGHNWHSMSFSRKTGLAYIPAIESGFAFAPAQPGYQFHSGAPNMGIDPIGTSLPEAPDALAKARESLHGELIAWDPLARKAVWRVRHPVAWNGGTLVTDGGLVFQGAATGELVAYDARDGRRLWSRNLGAGIVAAPMTYSVNAVQYVAVAVGWGGGLSQVAGAMTARARSTGINRLVVLKLDGKGQLAEVPELVRPSPQPPQNFGNEDLRTQGRQVYERRCYVCHGSAAISGGEVPDLRYSAVLGDAGTFRSIVREGLIAQNGMPAFRDVDDAQAEAVRAYLVSRSNDLIAEKEGK